MRRGIVLLAGCILLLLYGCQPKTPVCQQAAATPPHLSVSPDMLPSPTPNTGPDPIMVEIGGRSVPVDRVVEGPLCNDDWSGTVYVSCNVQVYDWEEKPDFLKDCDLDIEPGTVVYVAYHNDTAYYNGCSCHTGETAGP